jgi:hypothetical protein
MALRGSQQTSANSQITNVAGVALNDILILRYSQDVAGGVISWPSGFTPFIQNDLSGPDGQTCGVAWKLATASEPANYTTTSTSGGASISQSLAAYSGRSTTLPPVAVLTTNITANGPTTFSAVLNGVTALSGDDIDAGLMTDSDNSTSASFTPPGSYTEYADVYDNSNGWSQMSAAYRANVSAGATGNLTFGVTLGTGSAGYAGYVIRIPDVSADSGTKLLLQLMQCH